MADIDGLPITKVAERAGHQSSFDRTGGNADFGNVLDILPSGEKVLLDLVGAGCVYRLWFTAYSPDAVLRVYFDDEPEPRIVLPMGGPRAGGLFGGQISPFRPPLVANAEVASGGAYCYVPLPFQYAIRMTTTDPRDDFYYNIDYHLFEPDTPVVSWTGDEDLAAVRVMWNAAGVDPKSQAGVTAESGVITLPAGSAQTILDADGPAQVCAISLTVPGLLPGPDPITVTDTGRAHTGSSRFVLAIDPANSGVLLSRRLDFGIGDQQADVSVDDVFVGRWSTPGSDQQHHWRDATFALPAAATTGRDRITVEITFAGSTVDWNEFEYRAICRYPDGDSRQTDRLDVGDPAAEAAHRYAIGAATWAGTRTFSYPAEFAPTDSGRLHRGVSEFTVAVHPANSGVVLRRRLDYGVADQTAQVSVDGAPVGTWATPGADLDHRWRDHGFLVPSRHTEGKSRIAVRIDATGARNAWTEYRYRVDSMVDAVRVRTDELDVGDPGSEAAHRYTVTNATAEDTRSFGYPPPTRYRELLNSVSLHAFWDHETTPSVAAPLGMLFGMGWFGPAHSRGLCAGINDDGAMYLYFPMPFAQHGELRLVNGGQEPVTLNHRITHRPVGGSFAGVGYYRTAVHSQLPTTGGRDILLLDTAGAGQVVGVVQSDQGSVSRWFLEGDERALVDGGRTPAVHGTGTEDFYNGAFYFSAGPYAQPVSGNPAHLAEGTRDRTSAYRELIADAIPFRSGVRFTIEHGGGDDTSTDVWTLVHYYLEPATRLVRTDRVVIGDPGSEHQHAYTITGQTWFGSRTWTFEGESDTVAVTAAGRAHTGSSEFNLAIDPDNAGVLLRRMFDQGIFAQRATVSVDDEQVGTWYVAGGNTTHRWREDDFAVPAAVTAGKRSIRVQIRFVSSAVDWNEFGYQALSRTS